MVLIKLRLMAANESCKSYVSSFGYNAYLDITLDGNKKWCKVVEHLERKWSKIVELRSHLHIYFVSGNGAMSSDFVTPMFISKPVEKGLLLHPGYVLSGDQNSGPMVLPLYYQIVGDSTPLSTRTIKATPLPIAEPVEHVDAVKPVPCVLTATASDVGVVGKVGAQQSPTSNQLPVFPNSHDGCSTMDFFDAMKPILSLPLSPSPVSVSSSAERNGIDRSLMPPPSLTKSVELKNNNGIKVDANTGVDEKSVLRSSFSVAHAVTKSSKCDDFAADGAKSNDNVKPIIPSKSHVESVAPGGINSVENGVTDLSGVADNVVAAKVCVDNDANNKRKRGAFSGIFDKEVNKEVNHSSVNASVSSNDQVAATDATVIAQNDLTGETVNSSLEKELFSESSVQHIMNLIALSPADQVEKPAATLVDDSSNLVLEGVEADIPVGGKGLPPKKRNKKDKPSLSKMLESENLTTFNSFYRSLCNKSPIELEEGGSKQCVVIADCIKHRKTRPELRRITPTFLGPIKSVSTATLLQTNGFL